MRGIVPHCVRRAAPQATAGACRQRHDPGASRAAGAAGRPV